jgi:hypothetical protein
MRNIIAILVIGMLMAFTTTADAQRGTYSTADTLTNADTLTWAYPATVSGNWHMLIQIELDSVSGTAIKPIFMLQASIDNDNWYEIGRDTLLPANNEFSLFELKSTPYTRYRIYILNTGTNRSAVRSRWIWKSIN